MPDVTRDYPNHASYFTSAERLYLDALWRQYDTVDVDAEETLGVTSAHDRNALRLLIEMQTVECVLRHTMTDLTDMRRRHRDGPPVSDTRPLGPGGGQLAGTRRPS